MRNKRDIILVIALLVTIEGFGQAAYGQTDRGRRVARKVSSNTAAQTYAMEYDTDRPGSDYRDFDPERADPNTCAAACARENQCKAWTYVKAGIQGPKARCWLKNEVPDQVENDGCISGLKAARKTAVPTSSTRGMEYNTNRNGSDFKDMNLRDDDPKLCMNACDREPRCMAWTYVKPGVQGESAHCWLKDEVPEPTEDESCVSGVKRATTTGISTRGMEYNTNRNGDDFKDMDLRSDDPKLCMNACDREPRCMAWTYVKSGVQGENAHCWLKDQVPEPTEDENCISGVKAGRR